MLASVRDHTYLLREGRWEALGTLIDTAGNANVAVGWFVVMHQSDKWTIEAQMNEFHNTYEVIPRKADAAAIPWTSVNPPIGNLKGWFALFEDTILSSFLSDDGRYSGSEAMRMVDADTYDVRGALYLDNGHVSSWSTVLKRKATS
jgi:hypothetical protein